MVAVLVINNITPVLASSSDSNLSIVGSYTEETKNQVIAEILANDPNALIFTSLEEYNDYIANLRNNITFSHDTTNVARSYRTSKHLQVNISGVAFINVYYDYFVDVGGIVIAIYPETVYSSMTGFSPRITYKENYLSVTQSSDTHIATDLMFSLTYYLLIDDLIKLGSNDFRYQFDHDCCTNTATITQVY